MSDLNYNWKEWLIRGSSKCIWYGGEMFFMYLKEIKEICMVRVGWIR